jgi:hypothetical protein
VLSDRRIDEEAQVILELSVRASSSRRVSQWYPDISGQDRCKASLYALGS